MGQGRSIPLKCRKCALLTAQEARSRHGESGDNCWNPNVCYARRSHARHRDRRNQDRRTAYGQQRVDTREIEPSAMQADLRLYRDFGVDAPIRAVAVVVRQNKRRVAELAPMFCGGMTPRHLDCWLQQVRQTLRDRYEIEGFNGIEVLPPHTWEQASQSRSKAKAQWQVDIAGVSDRFAASLVLYRDSDDRLVGLGVEIWRGSQRIAEFPPLDCRGVSPTEFADYFDRLRAVLKQHYGLSRFAYLERQSANLLDERLDRVQAEASEQAETEVQSHRLRLDLEAMWRNLNQQVETFEQRPIQLAIVAAGVSEIVGRYCQFAQTVLESLEQASGDRGLDISDAAFAADVRQSFEFDFTPFLLAAPEFERKPYEVRSPDSGSVVVEQSVEEMLNFLEATGAIEAVTPIDPMQMAHSENFAAWSQAIASVLAARSQPIRLQELVNALDYELIDGSEPNAHQDFVKTWLTLLLSGFKLEQCGEFYDRDQVWISSCHANVATSL